MVRPLTKEGNGEGGRGRANKRGGEKGMQPGKNFGGYPDGKYDLKLFKAGEYIQQTVRVKGKAQEKGGRFGRGGKVTLSPGGGEEDLGLATGF